ncbi:MAG: hypothetical protein JWO04_2198 [Gammaproteobacteria bacterium]|nr:hypothetical protein [Gammaproteobacteria bacterium]
MTQTTSGLTNGGVTNHYAFHYDDSLSAPINPGGPEPARTNAVIAACEADFNQMTGWFGNIGLDVNFTITVNVTQNGGGASWNLSGGNLTVTINPASGNANFVRYLLVAEITEQFMRAQGRGWYGSGTEGSEGEGLSRFLATQFLLTNGFGNPPPGFLNSNSWLSSSRADFVNNINLTDDGPDAITGCSLLFLWYLFAQLGFSVNAIVAAGASTLGGVYRNLTGDTADPFPFFKQLLDTAFPGTSTITTGNRDNPFPLGILSFWVDKGTFGFDEVTDVIGSASNGTFANAFWLVLEGFNRNMFTSLGIGAPQFSGDFKNLPGLTISPDSSGVRFESASNTIPQRIRFPFDVRFSNATLASFPTSAPVEKVLNAILNVGGAPLPGAAAVTEFELIAGADPYFTNVNPAQDNVFWLSQDLRVFTATPGINNAPVAGAPLFASDSFAGAYSYIQGVLGFLNNPANHFSDGTNDPFTSGVIPNQGGALTGDSSVSRFTFHAFPFQLFNNYNFAIARVRLRGTAGPAGEAKNAKVFFRMWSTQTADTGFDPNSTYLSHQDAGNPHWPLPAPDSHTLPFFATGTSPNLNDPNNPEYGTTGVNNQTITIQTGDNAWAYFGCFLNVYDPGNVVNGSPVQALLAGTHHCLVAQIAYDDARIINANGLVASPESSDKLAQRNLQLTYSDNPGPADTHRIPQTFDLCPGKAIASVAGELLDYPDELMIDWGQTPVGSVAHIYWPQISAPQVLELANRIYGTHLLSASDGNTVDCTVSGGVIYVPIPPGTGQNIAGLFTVDLPIGVTAGQEFNIVVRRVSTRRVEEVPPPQPGPKIAVREGSAASDAAAVATPTAGSRKVATKRMDTYAQGAGHSGGTFSLDSDGNAAATDASGPITERIPASTEVAAAARDVRVMRNWRYVVGTFQVKIPVTTREVMLRPEEDTLAVMKWRLEQMGFSNRWYPVLQRYISYISARVKGLGGDPDAIPASVDGAPSQPGGVPELTAVTGRVVEIMYDCFGRFEGFRLDECCGSKVFRSRVPGVQEIALRACRDCLLLTVYFRGGHEDCIHRLVISC